MEKANNYHQRIELSCSIEKAFEAITLQIADWWSTTNGTSDTIGDEFKVSFGEESYWKFKVINLVEPNEIIWECIESHQDHNLKGIDEEWLNTWIYWSFSKRKGRTRVDFLHDGLISTGICYEVCSNGWNFYILDSLKSFLESGKGKPSSK